MLNKTKNTDWMSPWQLDCSFFLVYPLKKRNDITSIFLWKGVGHKIWAWLLIFSCWILTQNQKKKNEIQKYSSKSNFNKKYAKKFMHAACIENVFLSVDELVLLVRWIPFPRHLKIFCEPKRNWFPENYKLTYDK